MKFAKERNEIIEKRKAVYRLDMPIVVLILLAGFSQTYVPFMTPILVVTAFIIFYRKLHSAAHSPCPKCLQPFGSKSKYVISVGKDNCQNCGLSLYESE
ncbi:hypothetical protein FLL45_22465 [Aliikangiella marina]|uniref:Uncharacterized protein n=1 Tax=Aliikangiella marina TaxID=1712262 RepID=A0A545T1K9_9GAMM|nr:hypothetical protein [Aliikangiella marina]TQV71094.1 hypothetical protein FLL45_22465 [Aliikangiella marina]